MLGVGTVASVGTSDGVGTTVATVAAGPPPVPTDEGADPYARERDAWCVLTAVDGLGPMAFAALLARYRSGVAIVDAAGEPGGTERLADTPPIERNEGRTRRPVTPTLAASLVAAVEGGPALLARLAALGIRAVTVEERTYPRRLAQVAMPPHVLFIQGEATALTRRHAVAVVGTRRPTTVGRTTSGRIASALVVADTTVVSGLAYGVDGAAHEAALRAGGVTVAVIGGGHAVGVPSAHRRLAAAIVRSGGAVVSELGPDVVPTRGTFPRRNRIISGLSDATVVVEAPARSGALVTASWALEQGRPCFLVPGPLDAPASAGCLAFLREFAGEARIVAGLPQLIADLELADVRPTGAPGGEADALTSAAIMDLGATPRRVVDALLAGHATVDEIAAVADLPVAAVLSTIGLLDRRGLVVGLHGRYRPAGALLGERTTKRPR